MKTIGFAGLSVLVMASLAACSGDDDQNGQPAADTGVASETGTDTGTPPGDSGAPDTNVGDTPSDAPVVGEPKVTVLKLSDTLHDRLFGVTFNSTATFGLRRVSCSCVWLTSSTAGVSADAPSSSCSNPRPMLPPNTCFRPAAVKIASTSDVVVVLPLEPVTPTRTGNGAPS